MASAPGAHQSRNLAEQHEWMRNTVPGCVIKWKELSAEERQVSIFYDDTYYNQLFMLILFYFFSDIPRPTQSYSRRLRRSPCQVAFGDTSFCPGGGEQAT
jgi:hypothetical protein